MAEWGKVMRGKGEEEGLRAGSRKEEEHGREAEGRAGRPKLTT